MSDQVRNIYEAADRMDVFGDANSGLFADLPIADELFTELKTVKQDLGQAGADRSSFASAGKSETASKAAVYNSIYRQMRSIARTAVIIKARHPEFDNKYILPRDRMPYREGIERAKAIYADSGADEDRFIGYGLKRTFRAILNDDITVFEGSGEEQIEAKTSSVGETANIDALVERFMEIHAPLNQIMKNFFADNPQKLAEWRTAAHIERKKYTPPVNTPNG